ncbi:MAG TPA: copper chaperone PCu(A)C [Stellaceae bacterium]|nr:copper chaperone PCu(A)C [Stellaceae bacterium]
MRRRALLLAPLSLLVAGRAAAKDFAAGPIRIIHPWAAPSATEAAAMFVELRNDSPRPDRLIAAATPVAQSVIFRERDGAPLEYFELLPRRPVRLRPGRRYIALRGLKRPLALDEVFPLTLRFAQAGSIAISVSVEAGPEDDV